MKVEKQNVFIGNLYKCTSFPTLAGAHFGIEFDCKMIAKQKIFITNKDGNFYEINDLKNNGKKATKILKDAKTKGDYFVNDLLPFYSKNETTKISLDKIIQYSTSYNSER